MTTEPAARPAPLDQAGQHLAAIAASLSASGITSRLTRLAGTPVLTAAAPGGGPDPATIAIHPDPYADPGPQLDFTCTWTPAPSAAPQATASVIAAVLNATRLARPGPRPSPRPSHADAARLAGFIRRHPSWSAFWDPRYGLWRTAEDDPGSVLYAETSDADVVISYITSCSQATARRPG